MPTDRAAARGDKAFVDRLFRIQPPIGADYSGEWQTDRLFRIQALDTVGGDLLLCNHDGCGAHQTSNATLSGTLRNRGSTSRPSVTRAALVGISDLSLTFTPTLTLTLTLTPTLTPTLTLTLTPTPTLTRWASATPALRCSSDLR